MLLSLHCCIVRIIHSGRPLSLFVELSLLNRSNSTRTIWHREYQNDSGGSVVAAIADGSVAAYLMRVTTHYEPKVSTVH